MPTTSKKPVVRPDEKTVKDAIRVILRDTDHYPTSLNWAVNYCRAAIEMTGEELRVQCLDVLNNIQKWRHEQARDVRNILKAFSTR